MGPGDQRQRLSGSRVDINIPKEAVDRAPGTDRAIMQDDLHNFRIRRAEQSHKKTFGRLLVVAGSREYTGAPMLTGGGGLRSGAGLVTVAVPEMIRGWVQPQFEALIVHPVSDNGTGHFNTSSCTDLHKHASEADAVVIGPGMGDDDESATCLYAVMQTNTPAVVDADGLRCLARHPDWTSIAENLILTPHPGEMRALLHGFGQDELARKDRKTQATALARSANCLVILKGLGTVLATPDGETAINTTGNSGLASAGTGDVLSGLIGGLLAQGFSAWAAASHGVCLHGLAAEIAPQGSRALTADDLLNLVGEAYREVTPFA